jgi:GNAT superfamily N-acetyltransferase
MDLNAVRELFDSALRADPPPGIGVEYRWFDGVLRATQGAQHFIGWWDFSSDRTVAIVEREAARVRSIGGDLRWQVCDHDRPEGLERALSEAGFEDQGLEKWLVVEASAAANFERPPGVDVRQVHSEEELAAYLAVAREAFDDEGFTKDLYLPRLHDEALILFLAYADGEPAATGRLEAPRDCPFAGLFDGGVIPRYRGAGLYRAIVADRAIEAARRGARYLNVNARETSRPILERLGFEPLTTMHQWLLKAPSPR